jgi:hypothetical protein
VQVCAPIDDWSDEISKPPKLCLATGHTFRREMPLGLAEPGHSVPYGTVLSRDALPGTSCQATIPTGRACMHFETASRGAHAIWFQEFRADLTNAFQIATLPLSDRVS